MMDAAVGQAGLMDRVYRHQRHIYDLTRKYYLLGRDRMIAGLDCGQGETVLELGCGTGRNLALIARKWPGANLHGLDISREMLETARRNLSRSINGNVIRLAQGDATNFDPNALFGVAGFDRVVFSYTLSMVPDWEKAIGAALAALNSGGQLHIVDFGDQSRLPRWFATLLNRWLGLFHVAPRFELETVLRNRAALAGATAKIRRLHGGYAVIAVIPNH